MRQQVAEPRRRECNEAKEQDDGVPGYPERHDCKKVARQQRHVPKVPGHDTAWFP